MTEEKESWHLSKGVSIAHLLSTFIIVGGLAAYALGQENRATIVEEAAKTNAQKIDTVKADLTKDIQQVEDAVKELSKEVKADSQRLEGKIDQLILMRTAQ